MGNRCPDCNKFVGLEIGEPEVNSVDLDGSNITAEVRLSLNCADCGSELMETTFYMEDDVPEEAVQKAEELNLELSAEEGNCEATDDFRPRRPAPINKKTGKPRPVPYRYQTHYYGVSLEVNLTLPDVKEEWSVTLSDEAAASDFDQLY